MKPFIIIGSFLLWMVSCHPSDNIEPPLEPPVEPDVEEPVEEGTPLLFEPNEAVTITVANETFTVDFSLKEPYIYEAFTFPWTGIITFPATTRERYIDYYKLVRCTDTGATDVWRACAREYVRAEYTLAQERFNVRCTSEMRIEVLQLVRDKQNLKYIYPSTSWCQIKTGIFLMAVIFLMEREHSKNFITEYNKYGNYGIFFSNLIFNCVQKFLYSNN